MNYFLNAPHTDVSSAYHSSLSFRSAVLAAVALPARPLSLLFPCYEFPLKETGPR
jgi:hypothetical protein